jgi:hypothetical protein
MELKSLLGRRPLQLEIHGDPAETLDRVLGRADGSPGGWVAFEDGREPHTMRRGVYVAFVEHGDNLRVLEEMLLHRDVLGWTVRGRVPLFRKDTIHRVRWLQDIL